MEKLTREQKYQYMRETLNEKQWRQYLGMEAKEQCSLSTSFETLFMGNGTIPSNLNQCDHFIPGRALSSSK